ncbi:hypothetical protein ACFFHF_16460 [Robertmurraya beringensis]|uniref:Response regulatory domain-containing protein n=1 Tax=Robertmurraya beringensis TaxID=641660 RepID=A0ABV6KTY9_9BACI
MSKKVLIAVGDKSYSNILIETFSQHTEHFTLSSQEVLHRRFLEEIVELEQPDILVIHDYYLESDFTRIEMKEQELSTFFRKLRVEFDDSIRIVFLCERPKGDLFLSSLVSMGIHDIFNSNSFDLGEFIEQLKDRPRFSRVEKFLVAASPQPIPQNEQPFVEEEENEPNDEDKAKKERKEKAEKPVVQKVIEKKVVQKVVNKNVIKRDYTVQVHNHTEKIVGIPIKKKLVMIGSPIERSGSTFVSHLLARQLTQMGILLMTFSNVQNLTVLIVLKLTDSLSKNEREAVHMLP